MSWKLIQSFWSFSFHLYSCFFLLSNTIGEEKKLIFWTCGKLKSTFCSFVEICWNGNYSVACFCSFFIMATFTAKLYGTLWRKWEKIFFCHFIHNDKLLKEREWKKLFMVKRFLNFPLEFEGLNEIKIFATKIFWIRQSSWPFSWHYPYPPILSWKSWKVHATWN